MADIQVELLPKNAVAQATVGPAFIGFIISMSMLGISIAQIIFYYRSFPRDGRVKKSIVLLLGFAFSKTVEYYEPSAHLCQSFVALLVHGFFCLRIWRVSYKNVKLCAVIILPALAQLGTAIYLTAAYNGEITDLYKPGSANPWLASVPFAANIVSNGAIAGSLTYYFRSYRIGMPRTEPVMQQLIWLSTSTGILTCLLTALTWTLSLTDPGGASWLAILFVVGKVYVNSMMANLNSRRHFRTMVERTIDYSMHASAFDTTRLATE
ncbi:hypothetical protein FIBSPDRAFT_939741 [Athelia psychrophila]|uniref:DUF6534 domain-containing protein n=1 Tax=Athelia psychrophila TaxID=1759441 RepID=A0A167X9X7_9AGAM|nr:hypothetical protein FIBSPDRAFT_939741 [Fibularhizoctonia sp. CBS 109695]